jgi:hypothetical protein
MLHTYCSLGFGNIHICFTLQGSLEASEEEPSASEETEAPSSSFCGD